MSGIRLRIARGILVPALLLGGTVATVSTVAAAPAASAGAVAAAPGMYVHG